MDRKQYGRTGWLSKKIPLWQAALWLIAWLILVWFLAEPIVGWGHYFLWLLFHPPM